MQYSLTINQLLIHNKYPTLNFQDGAILYFMRQFIGEQSCERFSDEHGKIWYWFANQKIIKELPMLQIKSKSALNRRMSKILELDFIDRFVDCNKTYYSFSENFFKLFRGDEAELKRFTLPMKSEAPSGAKTLDNQYTNINIPNQNIYIKDTFERFWAMYPAKSDEHKTRTYNFYKANNLQKDIRDILRATEHYITSDRVTDGYILNPTTFLNDSYKEFVKGLPNGHQKTKFESQKFQDEAAKFLTKLEWLNSKWAELGEEQRGVISRSNGEIITTKGEDVFNSKEVEIIRKGGGVEELLQSRLTTSTQEQIQRLMAG